MYGQIINFGEYKGKTIEYIFIKDYKWLYRAMKESNSSLIKSYVEKLPCIYPQKVKVFCRGNHHAVGKTPKATRVSFYSYNGRMIIHPNSGYFWCDECDIFSNGAVRSSYKPEVYTLKFEEVIKFNTEKDRKGFISVIKSAYGIRKLTEKAAYKLFWE